MRQETTLHNQSTFFNTIEATRLEYPALPLCLATQVYTGPKTILAKEELSDLRYWA